VDASPRGGPYFEKRQGDHLDRRRPRLLLADGGSHRLPAEQRFSWTAGLGSDRAPRTGPPDRPQISSRPRGGHARCGSGAYAMEELRAELSSAFIAAELGVPADIPQHASYISTWLGPLKKDKREIFRTGSRRAADRRYGAWVSSRFCSPARSTRSGPLKSTSPATSARFALDELRQFYNQPYH
jgi:hypothetical protein